jgi:hypothetical protein
MLQLRNNAEVELKLGELRAAEAAVPGRPPKGACKTNHRPVSDVTAARRHAALAHDA